MQTLQGTLSPHILPITDLKLMLSHLEENLPPLMHLPVPSEDTIHFYQYLHSHVLIANQQFLFLTDVPIQGPYTAAFQSTGSLLWISLTEISWHNILSVPNILELQRMRLWQ